MKKTAVITLIFVLTFALAACGTKTPSSSSSLAPQSAISKSASSQPASSAPSSSSTPASSSSTSQASIQNIEPANRLEELASQLTFASMGLTEDEYGIYYGEGDGFGFLMFYDPTSYQYEAYEGPVTVDENYVTISDNDEDKTFTFALETSGEDGTLMIDTGDFGRAMLVECEPIKMVEALDHVITQMNEMQELAADVTFAAMGVTEEGQNLYYASTESNYVMVIHDEEAGEYLSFVGPVETDGASVTITDEDSGMTFTFTIEDVSDDETELLIDTGDFGLATLAQCEAMEVVNALVSTVSSASSVA